LGSTFKEEDIDMSYSYDAKTITFLVNDCPLPAEAFFTVDCLSDGNVVCQDTFRISYTPSGIPIELMASSITRNSADLEWIPKGIETKWEIKYGLAGFDPGSQGTLLDNVTNIPFKLAGLEQGAAYDFYVRAKPESGENTNSWSWPGKFVTNHLINISIGDNGNANHKGELEAKHHENFSIEFLPNEGYHVQDAIIDGKSIGAVNSYVFQRVTSNHNINVTFQVNRYSVESYIYPPQSGSVSGAGEFAHGETVILIGNPSKGFQFDDWKEYGVVLGSDTALSVLVSKNRKLLATFLQSTGINDIGDVKASFFPNPSNSIITIRLENNQILSRIQVFNMSGKMLIDKNPDSKTSYELNVKNLPVGVYLVKLNTSHGILNTKILVIK
jgi:hypothetical protein